MMNKPDVEARGMPMNKPDVEVKWIDDTLRSLEGEIRKSEQLIFELAAALRPVCRQLPKEQEPVNKYPLTVLPVNWSRLSEIIFEYQALLADVNVQTERLLDTLDFNLAAKR